MTVKLETLYKKLHFFSLRILKVRKNNFPVEKYNCAIQKSLFA